MSDLAPSWQNLPLLKRLVPSFRRRAARLLWRDGFGVVRRDGALFLLDLRNWADQSILMRGAFERAQLAYLLAQIAERQCRTFLDVGANLGTYAIFVALRTPCRRIVAFEPDRRAYSQLRANLMLNGLLDRVETRELAVSDRTGEVAFAPGPDTHTVLSKIAESEGSGAVVPAVRLDDALSVVGERIALKIDIEGHERAALAGMAALLRGNRCFLQVECFARNAPDFIAAIGGLGYRLLHRIDDDHYFAND
jgi:FkbM family methyltransferase